MTAYWQKQMDHVPTKEYFETLVWLIGKWKKDRLGKPFSVLEMGTGWGISGSAFLDAGADLLVTIDCNQEAAYGKVACEEILRHKKGDQVVEFINDRMVIASDKLIADGKKFDLVYVDGAHDYEYVIEDLMRAADLVEEGGLIILDDFLHVKNIDPGERGDRYGVQRAAREFLLKTGFVADVVPTKVNGFLVIDTRIKNEALKW